MGIKAEWPVSGAPRENPELASQVWARCAGADTNGPRRPGRAASRIEVPTAPAPLVQADRIRALRPYSANAQRSTLVEMILHDFLVVELPAEEVRHAVLEGEALLAEGATFAYARGEQFRLRVGASGSGARLAKTVAVTVCTPAIQGEILNIPMLWEAVGTPGLFPRVDASLEIAPLAPALSQLTFFGRYDPPLGGFGQGLDRLVLHRLAEHTIRAFLSEVERRLATGHVAVQ